MITKEKRALEGKLYRMLHKDRIRNRKKEYIKGLRKNALEILGGKCAKCSFSDQRALQIDHINGGGTKEHLKIYSRGIYLKIARGEIDGYQVLCANCNWIKRFENNEHRI